MTRRLLPTVLLALLALAGCGTDDPPPVKPTPPTAAEPPAPPAVGACYLLSFAQVSQPTTTIGPRACRHPHTAQTFHVGRIDPIQDGHLLAVDSRRVIDQAARSCPEHFRAFVGGDTETRRLSRLKPVWFAPTLEQADRGEMWFRCDVVALAGRERLVPLPRQARGMLDREGALDAWGTCGTLRPDKPAFARVVCRQPHRWRAVATIDLPASAKYGGPVATQAADTACRDLAATRSDDPLKYQWTFEWPNRDLWRSGQKWGWCWVPDAR